MTAGAIFIWIRDFANRPTARLCYGYVPLYYAERKLAEHPLTEDDEAHIRSFGYLGKGAIDALTLRYPPPQQEPPQ